MIRPFKAVIAVLTVALMGTGSALAGGTCDAKVQSLLDELGIQQQDITSLKLIEEFSEQTCPQCMVPETTAWIGLKQCAGNLAFDFRTECRLRSAYTTGDCRVENLQTVLR